MTAPVRRTNVPIEVGDNRNRIRILEALVPSSDPPGPYETFARISNGGNQYAVILAEPGRVFGWNYHNENEYSVYFTLYDQTSLPILTQPVVQLGAPPEGGSGHMFNEEGILFATGIVFGFKIEISAGGGPTFPPANTATCEIFWMAEASIE